MSARPATVKRRASGPFAHSVGEPSDADLAQIESDENAAAAAETGAEAEEALGPQDVSTGGGHMVSEPTGEIRTSPPSEPDEAPGCDHKWEMSGDPVEDDEPTGEFCGKCGEVRVRGSLGI